MFAALCACNSSHGQDAVDSATADAPRDAAIDAAAVSAWDAPTGAPLSGVTLSDGWQDLRALSPVLEISGGWTDSLFAMPDGRRLLFAYEQTDFFEFYISNGQTQTLTGPPLAGASPPAFKIFEADLGAADWTITEHPVNSPDPSVVEASPAENASGDLMVLTYFTLPSGHAQLQYSQQSGGAWSVPAALAINSASCNDDNAKIIGELATGVTVVFESTRGDLAGTGSTCGARKLYTTTYASGAFSPIAAVAGISDASSDDSQPFLTADQSTLYWTGVRGGMYGIFTATAQGDGMFGAIHPIAQPTTSGTFSGNVALIGEASVVDLPEGSLLYMMCGVAMNTHGGMTFHDADYIQLEPCVARRPKI